MHRVLSISFFALALVRGETVDQVRFFAPYFNATPPILSITPPEWATLNASVGGRLFPGEPFAKPCFARYEGRDVPVDDARCAAVRRSYRNESLRTSIPAGQIYTQWETCQARAEACLLDFVNPNDTEAARPPRECRRGSVSNYYIDARTSDDVRVALAFARTTKVPLVIKNTGHDFKGRSSAPNSLGLWMHNFRERTYHPAFMPTCPTSNDTAQKPERAITLGAGVRWFEAYAFAEEHSVTLVGGADRTVGTTGGWLQGGGHGALSNTLGMGADRVLQFLVVTPDGELRIANACQNQDLFFALRGGGGGTFGVVIKATMRAAPKLTIQAVLVSFPAGASVKGDPARIMAAQQNSTAHSHPSASDEDPLALTRSLWTILVANAARWAKEGWGSYSNANSALYINPVIDSEAARESMRTLVEWGEGVRAALVNEEAEDEDEAEAEGGEGKEKAGVVVVQGQYDSWAHFFNLFADGNSADLGEPLAIASRLIPETSFATEESRAALLDALMAAEREAPGVRLLQTTPYNYPGSGQGAGAHADAGPALHPAWRTSIVHVTAVATWNWNATQEEIAGRYASANRAIWHVRRAIEEDGRNRGAAYVNEADVHEVDHEETFWGEHYPRLLEIKNKYDPDRLLDCWQCVGWNPDSPRFSCYV